MEGVEEEVLKSVLRIYNDNLPNEVCNECLIRVKDGIIFGLKDEFSHFPQYKEGKPLKSEHLRIIRFEDEVITLEFYNSEYTQPKVTIELYIGLDRYGFNISDYHIE